MCASIHLVLIALMVQSGLAIKCFNCDSASNEGCENMTDTKLVAEECNFEKQKELESNYNNNDRHWLLRISDIHYRPPKSELDTQMVCQKLVGTDEHKQRTTVRRCQLANITPCNFSIQKLSRNREVECVTCETDSCNGSSNITFFAILLGVATAATICMHLALQLFLFHHFIIIICSTKRKKTLELFKKNCLVFQSL